MKKSIFISLLMGLTFIYSCENQEKTIEPQTNFHEASIFLSEMLTSTLIHSVNNTTITVKNGNVELENPETTGLFLKENYFPRFSYDTRINLSSNASVNSEKSPFSNEQLKFLSHMDEAMMNVQSAEDLYEQIRSFRDIAIHHAHMTNEQKLEMLAIVEYAYSLHEFLINGGLSEIEKLIPENSSANLRVQNEHENGNGSKGQYLLKAAPEDDGGGCAVSWRDVWAGAVVGAGVGAVSGGYTGATAGTVAFPIIGTVTGGVSGAVVGGAFGFVSGALTTVAAGLITTCGR